MPERDMAPDGGWGWVVVFASAIIQMLVVGMMFSLSVLYVSWLDEFDSGKGTTSWIVSVGVAFMWGVAPIPAGLARRFGYRTVVFVGAFLIFAGFILSYFATSVYVLVITIGLITGTGCGFSYLPAVAMVALFFSKRRALAMGIATSGVGVGTFILAPFINWLVEEYSWRGAVLILSAVCLHIGVCGSLFRPVEEFKDKELEEDSKECQPMLEDEEKPDMGTLEKCAVNEAMGASRERVCNGNINHCKADSVNECAPGNDGNISKKESEICLKKTANLKTYLNSEHLRVNPNMGGSLRALTTPNKGVDPADVRQFSSQREISLWKNSGKKLNASVANDIQNLDILLCGSFHSLLIVEKKLDSLMSLQLNPSIQEISEIETERQGLARKWCSDFAHAMRPYLHLMRNGVFLLFGISNFLTNLSFLMPVLYMVDRALENNIEKTSAAILLSINGAGNLFGRLFFGFMADCPCMDKLLCYILALATCGVSTSLSAICGDSLALHSVYAFVFGCFIGAYVVLAPVVTVDLVGVSLIGVAYGIILAFMGTATLIGPPLAGWIVDWTGSYNISFIINGIFLFVSAVMLLPVVFIRRHKMKKLQSDDL